jgi:hypothetical protein
MARAQSVRERRWVPPARVARGLPRVRGRDHVRRPWQWKSIDGGGGAGRIRNPSGLVWTRRCQRGPSPAVMTAIVEGEMVDFFRDIGSQRPEGPPSPEILARVMAARAHHGIEIIGG